MAQHRGIEPLTSDETGRHSTAELMLRKRVGCRDGIEPSTAGTTTRSSTTELTTP